MTPEPTRNRYLDALRAVAILRVYLHHTLWFSWLILIFPSMSVMFALGGCLTAASLERRGSLGTIGSRVRRVLPPLWVLAAVAVPLMIWHGWQPGITDWLTWIVPLANPPTDNWGGAFALALWYIRVYLWFILLSPLLWWAFRRWPIASLIAPLALAAALYPLLPLPANRIVDVVWSTATYGACWLLGYARHTRLLDHLAPAACAAIAIGLGATAWVWGDPLTDPLSEVLWGTAFTLVLMRLRPTLAWLTHRPRLSRVVTAINARAVTIYIWHLPMLFAAGGIVALIGLDYRDSLGNMVTIAIGTAFTIAAVFGLGWIEDLAARRRPAFVPAPAADTQPRPGIPAQRQPSRALTPAVR